MDKTNILILDDEKSSRESLKTALTKYFHSRFDVWEAVSVSESLCICDEIDIHLAFLDVQLKDETSFNLLSQLNGVNFKTIFVTGYDEYAVRAFRYNAVDYILKPINSLEFREAIQKLPSMQSLKSNELEKLNCDVRSEVLDTIVLKDLYRVYFVSVADIQYCKSDGNYTTFYLTDADSITISKPIKEYEKLLKEIGFFRSHRSFLINLNCIKYFDRRAGGAIVMINNDEIPLARNKRESFMATMKIN